MRRDAPIGDYQVWSRARPVKGDGTLRGFEHVGKAIFCGQVKRKKKEHEAPGAEDDAENDTLELATHLTNGWPCGSKGWHRLNMETLSNEDAWVKILTTSGLSGLQHQPG
jgi:hypothetical protein